MAICQSPCHTGARAGLRTLFEPLKLSESGVVDLLFLVFLLRINFDKMRHFYTIGSGLLRSGIKIISG
ncbi:conserved hypothetical protein [Pseudomonas serbica]